MIKPLLSVLVAALVAPSFASQADSSSPAAGSDIPTAPAVEAQAQPDSKGSNSAAEVADAKMAGPSEDLKTREDPNRRICKNAAPTGTRIGKRTCLTAAQWAEAQRIAKEGANNAQTSALMINKKGD